MGHDKAGFRRDEAARLLGWALRTVSSANTARLARWRLRDAQAVFKGLRMAGWMGGVNDAEPDRAYRRRRRVCFKGDSGPTGSHPGPYGLGGAQ
jgi:hypothetical protein